ncbi:MAG TPA: hypothetical protein VN843_07230 [Anaerolineales bacterium]|nr:hypothetical protein [Anaerolineales bacterium]
MANDIKTKQLVMWINEISREFYDLRNELSSYDEQMTVLMEQESVIISLLDDHSVFTDDPQLIFDRNKIINDVVYAVRSSVNALSDTTVKAEVGIRLDSLQAHLYAYFDVVDNQ